MQVYGERSQRSVYEITGFILVAIRGTAFKLGYSIYHRRGTFSVDLR